MYIGIYKIAGHIVEIDSIYSQVQQMCTSYQADLSPEYCVRTSQEDIDRERVLSQETMQKDGVVYEVTDPYLETLAVYRKICDRLMDHGIMLIHGSCLAVDGCGFLFTARSGTGKSTHTRNWKKLLGDRVTIVNDDKPLVDTTTGMIYGTPWNGKHCLGENVSVPLSGIVLLERGLENSIAPIPAADAITPMLSQAYIPSELQTKAMALLSALMDRTRFFQLRCNMDVESARVAYDGLISACRQTSV
ncbi:MAG: hypothetical protein MJZ66_01810 [Bacteroidales bacterium]|nr:hypothetical protein [Bacteroidales bacterium]